MRTAARWANGLTLFMGDVTSVVFALWASYGAASALEAWIGWDFVNFHKGAGERAAVAIPVAALCLVWLSARGHYRERLPHWSEVRDVIAAALMATVAEVFIQYSVKDQVSRLWILLSWSLLAITCVAVRVWMKWALTALGLRQLDVVLIGDKGGAAKSAITSERLLGYRVVLDIPHATPEEAVQAFIGSGAALAMVAVGTTDMGRAGRIAAKLSEAEIPFALCPPLGALGLVSMRPLVLLGHETMLLVERRGLRDPVARALKRSGDVGVAMLGLIVTAPVIMLAAAVVSLDGAAPFYGHERIGRNGRPIKVWKLRSMVVDADARLAALLARDPRAAMEWETDRKLRTDPRVTAFGRLLRRTALDEVPQLWNVLTGEMALVGPRPVTRTEMTRYGSSERLYVGVRPGLTGLWQVSGRNSTTYERRVELDSWYVRNWSLWVDLVILAKTFTTVVMGKGAF